MRIKERLDNLAKRKGLSSAEERFEAHIEIFRLIHEREPTAAEIDELRAEATNQKPRDLKQTIAEIEQLVYERDNE